MGTLAKYDQLWSEARHSMLLGELSVDHNPMDGEPRWGLTLVALPSGELKQTLVPVLSNVRAKQAGRHHSYDAATLHMTITSLEPHRATVDPALVDAYAAAVDELDELLDFEVEFRGLGGSRAGVFAQGYGDDKLHRLRVAMREAGKSLHDGIPTGPSFVRDTAHISLTVFRERAAEPNLVNLVNSMRTKPLGRLRPARIALVHYLPVDGAMRLQVLRELT